MNIADTARAWPAATFQIASRYGVTNVAGYAWLGLGLHMEAEGSPKGKRPPRWALTHLGSGHKIFALNGDVRTAFPVASEIALAGDWTFDGLNGWRNQFPDCQERVREIAGRYPAIVVTGGAVLESSEDQARSIAVTRAA